MANGSATEQTRYGYRTICLPIDQDQYQEIIQQSDSFRNWIDTQYRESPELFPVGFDQGYGMKDQRTSKTLGVKIRRIVLRGGEAYSVRPSFVMPGMTAKTDDVQHALFLRKWGVPYWALARIFGRNATFWYRLELTFGRNSIVGSTVKTAPIPRDLLADEHHQKQCGEKVYIATTVGSGCVLGAELCETASTEDLTDGYKTFREEALSLDPEYEPETVNTDGWKGTQCAWRKLFPMIAVIQCFLHAWLKIRDRGKNLKQLFFDLGDRVWEVYRAPDRRSASQRMRQLKSWAEKRLTGSVLEKVVDLCNKRDLWALAYKHPSGFRTSNMLDRLMRGMNRYFERGQNLHGSQESSNLHTRSWALLHNYWPWSPESEKSNGGHRCAAERLNNRRYHENWLANLLVSTSLAGTQNRHPKIRND